jgi:hypothetical protein
MRGLLSRGYFLIFIILPYVRCSSQTIETYPMAPATKKLTLETLRRNGIIIEMEISEDGWPEDIAQVKDRILSFDCIIPPKEVELYLFFHKVVLC